MLFTAVLTLMLVLFPAATVRASGVFWLPTETASDVSFNHLNPVLAAYHNHAYALSVRVVGSAPNTSVYLTTNESGHWSTQLVSTMGPHNTYSGEFASLAVDSTSGRLYAIWAYTKTPQSDAVGVWTRDAAGEWSGPTDIATGGALGEQPTIVAQGGKAYAAFISASVPGSCDDSTTRDGDLQVAYFDGSHWSSPENLTSCVVDSSILGFSNAKIALDDSGRAYVVTTANGDLWFTENTNGSWSNPAQISHGANIPISVGTALRTFYGIAAGDGAAYVGYIRQSSTSAYDVMLTSHTIGGAWSTPNQISPQDVHGCPKFGLSMVASGARVGVAYVRAHTGYCASASGVSSNEPFLYTFTSDRSTAVTSLVPPVPDCFATAMAAEGALFRFLATCDHPTSVGIGQLYYKAEFLDTIGPVSHLVVPAGAKAPSISLHWSARDPKPGSGVDVFELQVLGGTGWHALLAATHSKQFAFRSALAGHRYVFRLRARDRAANWGKWVKGTTQVH